MIDFETAVQRTNDTLRNNEQKVIRDDVIAHEYGSNRSDAMDLARQMIAARPAICFAIALAVGGAMGWLTSKN